MSSEFTRQFFHSKSPEISGKTLNGKINFSGGLQGVPVHREGVVRELLNVSHQPQTVLGVHIDDPLLYLQKEISMKLVMSIVNPILIRFFYLKIHSIRKK